MLKSISVLVIYLIVTKLCFAQQAVTSTHALNKKQHSLVVIAALAGKGDTKNLHAAFNQGLDAGWTINELKETAVHIYAYAGFPRSLNTLSTLQTVLKERKEKGIKDEPGTEPNPLPTNTTKLELGTTLQAKLLGRTMKTSTADFAPIIDVFLKEHLFGDIFGRDNLDFKTREFITISTLAGLGGADNQLRSHINVGMYNGITENQLYSMVEVLQQKVGARESNGMNEILQSIFKKNEPDTTDTVALLPALKTDALFATGQKITNTNFTGTAYLQPLVTADSINATAVGNVTFEPGARTNWHYHPGGQILLVTDGVGYYQEKGQPKKILRKGDVIKCAANVLHWHGASSDTGFIQIAITNNQKGATVWLQPVTDEEFYGKGN